jgi:hypothetical protein
VFNSYKKLKAGDLKGVDNKLLFPLLRWCSGSITDLHWCQEINRVFFWLPPEVAKGLLYLGMRDHSIGKYPKAEKIKEDRNFALKKKLIMRYYGWGEQEFERTPGAIDHVDFEEIASALGCSDKERKMLGLSVTKLSKIKFKKEEAKKTKPKKSIFDFG